MTDDDLPIGQALRRYEADLIVAALAATEGNVTHAAERLGEDRANLYRRMRRLGLRPREPSSD